MPPEEGQLLQLLTDTQIAMARLFADRATHLGFTRPQWRVLGRLYGNNGLTQSELSQMTGIARSPLGKIIDQLEQKGLVERRDDPDDRRVNRLHVTPAVEPLVEPTRQVVEELEHSVLEGLPRTGSLVTQLAALKARLQQLADGETQAA